LLWPAIVRTETSRRGWVGNAGMALTTVVPVALVLGVATFPGEWWAEQVPYFPLRRMLVAGEPDLTTRRPASLWSNVLVLPGFDVIDHVKFDTEDKISALPETISLRGRHLEGVFLGGSKLRNADFTGAYLQGASLEGAQLLGASLKDAELQGALLVAAQIQGVTLDGAELQAATLEDAQLQGASLDGAQLHGASLKSAFVWRADPPNASDNVAVSANPIYIDKRRACEQDETKDKDRLCSWSKTTFDALKRLISDKIPVYVEKARRDGALTRIDPRLNPNQGGIDQDIAEIWRRLEDHSRSLPDEVFDKAREEEWRRAGCDPEQAPYVVEALAPRLGSAFGQDIAARLAAAFLGNECAGARGISAETRATLEWLKQASTHDLYTTAR
jgi:hypothetical protein